MDRLVKYEQVLDEDKYASCKLIALTYGFMFCSWMSIMYEYMDKHVPNVKRELTCQILAHREMSVYENYFPSSSEQIGLLTGNYVVLQVISIYSPQVWKGL